MLLVTMTLGVRAYSQSRSVDSFAILYGYGLCDGSPCFLGIKPGITTWVEAKKIVLAHYPNALIDNDNIYITYGADSLSIQKDPSNAIVYHIGWDSPDASAPISALLAKFGSPCFVGIYPTTCMGRDCTVDYVELHYNTGFVGLNLGAIYDSSGTEVERLNLDLPTDLIYLTVGFVSPKLSNPCEVRDSPIVTPWLGFASIRHRYLTYAETHK
jgi:hypothetical protein